MAPSIIAVDPLPGMPKASIVVNAPPVDALPADPGAIIPSGFPLPNASGFLDVCFVWLYARKAAMVLPAAGRAPTIVPMTL
jgi:hypothetical protein